MDTPSAALLLLAALAPAGPAEPTHRQDVHLPADDPAAVPDFYRLAASTFTVEWHLTHRLEASGVDVYAVRFPSAVASPHPSNNTVHAEYFVPRSAGRGPAAVVLDILDGRGTVSRAEAVYLASKGVAALAMVQPYYGPRRPAEGRVRMLSPDVAASVANVRQAVLDGRRAVAWLAARPEVDARRLGVVGTSLGSFVGGLLAAAEPRVRTACLLLGGGGLVDAFSTHPLAAPILAGLSVVGLTPQRLKQAIAPGDPLTYADRLKGKRLLLIAARRDDVVPPAAMTRLWEATGRPRIVWYDATHVGAAAHAFPAMQEILAFLSP
jgi:dienelactone hydrolase